MRPNSVPAISRPFAGVKGKLASLVASGDLVPAARPRRLASIAGKLSFPAGKATADSVADRLHTRSQAHVNAFWRAIDEQGRER